MSWSSEMVSEGRTGSARRISFGCGEGSTGFAFIIGLVGSSSPGSAFTVGLFESGSAGCAFKIGFVLFLVILAFTVANMRLARSTVELG